MAKKARTKTAAKLSKAPVRRPKIPAAVERSVKLANRHACCVCQKPRVQLHHIDSDPKNNEPTNIAALCLTHHDMATMQIGLTKKLKPDEVRSYKRQWEQQCRNDVKALSRQRFTFYYCIYKNPERLTHAFMSLSEGERVDSARRLIARLIEEEARKKQDTIFGLNAVPRQDDHTAQALDSILKGEMQPSYLEAEDLVFEPGEPYRSPSHYMAYHKYDLWCQLIGQTLAEARGVVPLEDLLKFTTAKEIDFFEGSLVTYRLTVQGKGVRSPRFYKEQPTATVQAKHKVGGRTYVVTMTIRTKDIFSDTSAENLRKGRVSGLAIMSGAADSHESIELRLIPLLIGTGGWNIYPEHYE